MIKLVSYIPVLLTLIVIFTVDKGWGKGILLVVLAAALLVSKYRRSRRSVDEVEYDERVNLNIRYWSFGFLVIMNTILIIYFILMTQSLIPKWMTPEGILVYLSASLLIAFYIIPNIARRL